MGLQSTFKTNNFSILEVVQNYIKTTQKGINHWAICPFHKDNNPSLSISQEKNVFKCFSCNVCGDAISFVMMIEKCGYSAAIIKITKILNLNPNDYLFKIENSNHKLYKINDLIASSYHRYLFNKESKRYLDYLTKIRGLTLEIIEKYKLGFAPEKDILQSVFKSYLDRHTNEKFGDEEYKKLGIYVYGPSGTKNPFFTKKIIFPILNKDSQIVGFGGRSIDGEVPKYLNVKTGVLFQKKDSVFNINNLKEENPIYIYEGFIDLLKAEICGIKNGIACMGSSLSPVVFETLYKFSRDIILCFDNDNTGRDCTINTFNSMIENGFRIKVVDLIESSCKDIDEYLSSPNKKKAIEKLNNPINFFEWLWKIKSLNQNLRDPIVFHYFISESLNYLFSHERNLINLKNGVDISFANESIKIIFDFYKQIPEFQSEKYLKAIEKKRKKYEEVIIQLLIENPTPSNVAVKFIPANKKFSEIVSHSHVLSRTPINLTLEQEKTLYLIFSKLNPLVENPLIIRIEKSMFFKALNISSENKYFRYREILTELIGKSVMLTADSNAENMEPAIRKITWYKHESFFEVFLDSFFMRFLERLSTYTQVSIKEICSLNTKYSLVLYRFAKSWAKKDNSLNWKYETVETFRRLFNLKNKYPKANDIFKYALKPSVDEINKKTKLKMNITKTKYKGKIKGFNIVWEQ